MKVSGGSPKVDINPPSLGTERWKIFMTCASGLTNKAEPPRTCDVNNLNLTRKTAARMRGWLRRLVRLLVSYFVVFRMISIIASINI